MFVCVYVYIYMFVYMCVYTHTHTHPLLLSTLRSGEPCLVVLQRSLGGPLCIIILLVFSLARLCSAFKYIITLNFNVTCDQKGDNVIECTKTFKVHSLL